MPGKSLEGPQKEVVCALVEKIVNDDFDGNVTRAAKKIGISASFITEMIERRRGPGNKALDKLADYTGKSTDELMGRKRPKLVYAGGENRAFPPTAIGNHPSFEKQWKAAVGRYGRSMDLGLHDRVASVSGGFGMPEELPIEFIKQIHDAVAMAEAAKAEERPKHR